VATIQQIIATYQRQLANLDDAATARLLQSYQAAYTQLEAHQAALLAEIATMENVTSAAIYKRDRYQRLISETRRLMDRYGAVIEDQVRADAPGVMRLGTDQARDLIQGAFDGIPEPQRGSILATFQVMPTDAIEAMTAALLEDSPLWTETLASFGDDAAQGIADELITHLLSGKNPIDTARAMMNVWGVPLTRALRIARTEHLRAFRAASLVNYQRNAHLLDGWRWHANLDVRTCMSCVNLHGTLFPLTETMSDHIAGRCVMIPEVKSLAEYGLGQVGYDLKEGDGERWFNEQPEKMQKGMMGPGKYEAWQANKFKFSALSTAKQSKVWGRMFVETTLGELIGGAQ